MTQENFRSGLSQTFLRSCSMQETKEVYITLLSIDHENLPIPLRAAANRDNVISREQIFAGFSFDLVFPNDDDERPPVMQLEVDNTSREFVEALRTIGGQDPAECKVEFVLASQPDHVEVSLPDFKIHSATHNAVSVTADLTLEDHATTPYPADDFGRNYFPGI